jgi:glycosyltransferase involved in cell wall biosynthesis
MDVSVVIPTHNPHAGRLSRTLAGLKAQRLPRGRWEVVLVDNASVPAVTPAAFADVSPPDLRLVREPLLGLSSARRRGFVEARARFIVLVDDDNVLSPDYLADVMDCFERYPCLGAFGGKSLPEFDEEPPAWQREFFPLLALRDLGNEPLFSGRLNPDVDEQGAYPVGAAPIGAGMAIRREAALQWVAAPASENLTDRHGAELTSGGDNDIVLTVLRHGWEVAYLPQLRLTHLIPNGRLDAAYLARLNRGIQKSWMQVLTKHGVNPWPSVPRWTVHLRKLKAWVTYRAWAGPAARIRWQGACGHFEGRISQR